jgi:hypothetical protein
MSTHDPTGWIIDGGTGEAVFVTSGGDGVELAEVYDPATPAVLRYAAQTSLHALIQRPCSQCGDPLDGHVHKDEEPSALDAFLAWWDHAQRFSPSISISEMKQRIDKLRGGGLEPMPKPSCRSCTNWGVPGTADPTHAECALAIQVGSPMYASAYDEAGLVTHEDFSCSEFEPKEPVT